MDPSKLEDLMPSPSTQPRRLSARRLLTRKRTAAEARAVAEKPDGELELAVLQNLMDLTDGKYPSELVEALTAVREGRMTPHYGNLSDLFWLRYRDELPYSKEEWAGMVKQVIHSLRKGFKDLAEGDARKMNSFFKKLPELFERLGRLAAVPGGPGRLAPELIAEILNVVRVAASRILPRDYGAGIRDVDVDDVERLLLAFGADWPRVGAKSEETVKDVPKDLARFLSALNNYDPESVASDYVLVNSGARLVVALAGAKSLLGLLAQLNVYVVIRELMPARDYADAMQHIAEAAEALIGDTHTNSLHKELNRNLSESDELPRASRLASYCRFNLTFTALSTALKAATSTERQVWAAAARAAADQMAQRDSAFEQVPWCRLAVAAVTDLDAEPAGEFNKFIAKVGLARASAILESIRAHSAHDALIEYIEAQFAKVK